MMSEGGLPNVNARTEQLIRFAGFLVPVILMFYGLLLMMGAVKNEHPFNLTAFAYISVGWAILSVYQFLVPAKTRLDTAVRLVLYHALSVAYILFVSGLDMPFMATWVVLLLASFTFWGREGLNLSILALFATMLADILLTMDQAEYIARDIMYFLGTLLVGYVAATIMSIQRVDRDELARSQSEESHQRDRIMTLVNNLADGILSTDNHGVIQVFNAATLNLLDTNTSLNGKHIDDVIRLLDKDNKRFKFSSAFRSARGVISRDDLSATISEETLHLSVIFSPIRGTDSDDETDGYIVILRDITKQKSLEEERDEFISVVSHELRTPITIAEGTLSNVQLMMTREDIPKATLATNVTIAHDQVLFLAKMVNDLSTLSRAERGVADAPESINVSDLIHDLYNEYAPQAETKGLKFNLDLDPGLGEVVASRLYLKELLQNFVTNAIKYTKEGSVLVSVKAADTTLKFSVQDTGIGMSKSDQKHVFEKFWRSEDYRTRETGGTGLGLYVARKLAKKLGVTIEMTSRLNHGSTFGFSMSRR